MTGDRTTFAIVGAGGLGGPIAYALAAAGAHLVLCDDDAVELSNLQRQIQFATADLGRRKVDALAAELGRRGVGADRLRLVDGRFTPATAAAIADGVDVLIDGSDNFATKFAVADFAVAAGLRHVVAGVHRYGGQVFSGAPGLACYRCLFEAPPGDGDSDDFDGGSCADAGVLGAIVGVLGGAAARAALALAAGDLRAAGGLDLWLDLRRGAAPRRVSFAPRPGCPACAAASVRPSDISLEEAS